VLKGFQNLVGIFFNNNDTYKVKKKTLQDFYKNNFKKSILLIEKGLCAVLQTVPINESDYVFSKI
jgi:hypothetical protein